MAQRGSAHSSPLKLRVASWGDPDLELEGFTPADNPFDDAGLAQYAGGQAAGVEYRGLNTAGPSPAQQPTSLIGDSLHAASGGIGARISQGAESGSGGDNEPRRHNLRPRVWPQSLGAHPLDQHEEDEDGMPQEDLDEDFEEEKERTGKRRVGRPIAYKGDPDSPHLTEAERRRMKRRLANRESARRVRTKRQELLHGLQRKISAIEGQNQELAACISGIEQHKANLTQQLGMLRQKWGAAKSDNSRLKSEVTCLRQDIEEQRANPNTSLVKTEMDSAGGSSNAPQQMSRQQQQPLPSGFPIIPALPTAASGSSSELHNLMRLTSLPTLDLLGIPGDSQLRHAPSGQTELPRLGDLPDISPLTGLHSWQNPSSQPQFNASRSNQGMRWAP